MKEKKTDREKKKELYEEPRILKTYSEEELLTDEKLVTYSKGSMSY